MKILTFSGSLRKNSTNTGLIRAVVEFADKDMDISLIDISHLPLYNEDMEVNFPKDVSALKDKIKSADGVIIATPEYNRSVPGVLKNMLDWTSRPYGDNAWDGKLVAIMGASYGEVGTALGQYHLKQILLYLNAHLLGQPEFYVGNSSSKFDNQGNLTDAKTREHIKSFLKKYKEFYQSIKH